MTPEEERFMRMQVQQLISQGQVPGSSTQMQSGTVNPYANDAARQAATARASVNTKGRSAQLAAQQALAQQMRGKGMPKGRTVGPYNVYMGPNWGETAAGLANTLGGALIQRGLKDDYAALDEIEADKAAAEAELKQMDLADARGFTTSEREAGQVFSTGEREAGQEFSGEQQGLRLSAAAEQGRLGRESAESVAEAGRDAQADRLQTQIEFDSGKGATKTYVGPDGPLTVIEDTQGVSWITDENGKIDQTIDVSGLKELDEQRSVTMTAAEAEALDAQTAAAENADFGITQAEDIFRAPDEVYFGGVGLTPESVATGFTGFAMPTEFGPQIQEHQRRLQKLGFEGMSEDFKRLNLGQIAKNEFDSVSKANAGWKTEPYGQVMLQVDKIPLYEKAFNKGIDNGSHTTQQRDAQIQKMTDDVIFGAARIDPSTGKPTVALDELRRKGIDVTARRNELAEKVRSGTSTPEDEALLTVIIRARKAED